MRFDAAPENTGNSSEQFNIRDNTFDLSGTFNIAKYTALKVAYTYDDINRTGRSFSDTRDYTFRTSLDTVGNQYVMMRFIYEHGNRIGSGFDEMTLEDGGAQPGLRFYDEADRDRNKGTLLFVLTPVNMVDVTFSVASAKDIYNGPGHDFGLLNNTNTSYNAGINLSPKKQVGFGANYGYEKFESLQNSANANPVGSDYGSWTDPNRVWNLTNGEKVNNFDLYLDLKKAVEHTDIRFTYDYSDSDNGFTFGGPRITELTQQRRADARRHQAVRGRRDLVLHPAAERHQQVAALRRRPEVLLHAEGRLRTRLLVREVRRHRLRDDGSSGPARRAADRQPRRDQHRLREPAVQGEHRVHPAAVYVLIDGLGEVLSPHPVCLASGANPPLPFARHFSSRGNFPSPAALFPGRDRRQPVDPA